MSQETAYTFGSLFAGIGGIDLGFERAGMQCAFQVEMLRDIRCPSVCFAVEDDFARVDELHRERFKVFVNRHMLLTGAYVEVAGAIVAFDTVDVVNHFVLTEFPTQHLFGHQNVLWGVSKCARPLRCADHDIAPLVGEAACRREFPGRSSCRGFVGSSWRQYAPVVEMPVERLGSDPEGKGDLSPRLTGSHTRFDFFADDRAFVGGWAC